MSQHHDITNEELMQALAGLPVLDTSAAGLAGSTYNRAFQLRLAIKRLGYDIRKHEDRFTEHEVEVLISCAAQLRDKVHQHERTMGVDQKHNHHVCIAITDMEQRCTT
jgi:hypothetical protein